MYHASVVDCLWFGSRQASHTSWRLTDRGLSSDVVQSFHGVGLRVLDVLRSCCSTGLFEAGICIHWLTYLSLSPFVSDSNYG